MFIHMVCAFLFLKGRWIVGERKYKINKILNNNVILAIDIEKKQEIVLVGKGIGFSKKINEFITLSDKEIEKSFLNFDESTKKEYINLINEIDDRIIIICEKIIKKAEEKLGKLNNHIHIALTDHISFAIERAKSGMGLNNPFLYEIQALYPKEFEIGLIAIDLIKSELGVDLKEVEAGFIALHIHSARQNKNVGDTIKNTKLLLDLIKIIETELNIEIGTNELTYTRLINHLRTSLNRMEENKNIKNPLLNIIKEQFAKSYQIANKIGEHIAKVKSVEVSEDELGYLALHIERIKEVKNFN
ncbi:PRD domain-containing protein [Soehngenia longivitae]|uniref:PRD domain-containing protein n=1 Tax=Soehngenia longivitae TaxID=2562294 RepID=A0A4Z0DA12_9FIRM|nr:PRD domain-containing protein [Soehngenia longivitae]